MDEDFFNDLLSGGSNAGMMTDYVGSNNSGSDASASDIGTDLSNIGGGITAWFQNLLSPVEGEFNFLALVLLIAVIIVVFIIAENGDKIGKFFTLTGLF